MFDAKTNNAKALTSFFCFFFFFFSRLGLWHNDGTHSSCSQGLRLIPALRIILGFFFPKGKENISLLQNPTPPGMIIL
ncbi:hypothetical protein ACN42_g2976 [Penicillium freii]|uniref:Uncharacterized protein n=1 Tax=Penicillium freii TaxID=48697 RepID=A0A101MP47_PENFR|nr:hypothetical protein ACN42_g2976 [Penicillium freii]